MIGQRLIAVAGRLLTLPPQLLLNGEGTNGGTSILDSSGNAFSITNSGVTTSTTQFKKGASSLAFGTSGFLTTPLAAQLLCASTADWTIDTYMYVTSIPDGSYSSITFSSGGGTNSWASAHNFGFYLTSAMNLYLEYRNGGTSPATLVNFGSTIAQNAWVHLAITYTTATNTLRTYLNGVLDTTNTLTGFATVATTPKFTIGRLDATVTTSPRPYGGYMDQYRVTQGLRWAANFTPD